jgi:hypothetical protein
MTSPSVKGKGGQALIIDKAEAAKRKRGRLLKVDRMSSVKS